MSTYTTHINFTLFELIFIIFYSAQIMCLLV